MKIFNLFKNDRPRKTHDDQCKEYRNALLFFMPEGAYDDWECRRVIYRGVSYGYFDEYEYKKSFMQMREIFN
jgi:hypothetical protein